MEIYVRPRDLLVMKFTEIIVEILGGGVVEVIYILICNVLIYYFIRLNDVGYYL